eukprot:7172879-Lingulodinium_polyedra.AAC.1
MPARYRCLEGGAGPPDVAWPQSLLGQEATLCPVGDCHLLRLRQSGRASQASRGLGAATRAVA